MTDAEIVARMRKALETWEAQAAGMRMTAAEDLKKMNLEGAIYMAKQAVTMEAVSAFIRMCLDADS